MDFDTYSYIITDGFELLDLYYIPGDSSHRLSFSPIHYGYATLKKVDDDIHIYRIPCEVPIQKDLHAHNEDDFRTTVIE